jgi:acetyl esterase/lipase
MDETATAQHNAAVMARFEAQMAQMMALDAADPSEVRTARDIEFARPGDRPLRLDLYLPARPAGPLPLIVWVHGGAWRIGDRTRVPPRIERFAAHGLAVASIEYRLSHEAHFPAQIDDVRTAVGWLRTHAGEYGLDPGAVGLWGASAGAQLVALAATTAHEPADRVHAVVDGYGPTTFRRMDEQRGPDDLIHGGPRSAESLLLGVAVNQAPAQLLSAADPIAHVTAQAPPFLIIHGTADLLVPPSQSVALHDALVAAGADSTLCLIDGGFHGLFMGSTLDVRPPPQAEIRTRAGVTRGPVTFELIARFFDRHLRHDPWSAR